MLITMLLKDSEFVITSMMTNINISGWMGDPPRILRHIRLPRQFNWLEVTIDFHSYRILDLLSPSKLVLNLPASE